MAEKSPQELVLDKNTVDLSFAYEEELLFDEEKGPRKLFYLNKDFIGAKDCPENKLRLKEILKAIIDIEVSQKSDNVFLLCSEAVKTLTADSEFAQVWEKAIEAGLTIFVSETSVEDFIEADDLVSDKLILINNREVAETLLSYHVLTLT